MIDNKLITNLFKAGIIKEVQPDGIQNMIDVKFILSSFEKKSKFAPEALELFSNHLLRDDVQHLIQYEHLKL